MTGKRRAPPADTRPVAANDNLPPISKEAQAALDRIARAIGRHIARELMGVQQAANNNE
ncbi:MAG: hypothetical protein QM605_14500 [Sphingobium sp.]